MEIQAWAASNPAFQKPTQILGRRYFKQGKQMFDLQNQLQDAELFAASRRWNFDDFAQGCGQQGMYASWK
jgi:hypothetical protein